MNQLQVKLIMIRLVLTIMLVVGLTSCATLEGMVDAVIDPVAELVTGEPEIKTLDERSIQSITEAEIRLAESNITSTVNLLMPSDTRATNISNKKSLSIAISSYEKLLASSQSTEIRQEALHKLAELSVIQAEQFLVEDDNEKMQQSLAAAENYYQALINEYPSEIELTAVQYQLARVKDLKGETDGALKLINTLSNSSIATEEVVEARFRLAERYYSQKNYPKAQGLYDEVLLADNRFYNSALFKRGWTHFQRQNFDYALNDFIELLSRIYEVDENRSKVTENLLNETYRVSALSLSYLDGPQTLAEYFREIEQGTRTLTHASTQEINAFEADLYMGLARLYEQQERLQDTANTYITFVRENPYTESAPMFEHRGIEVLSKSGFLDLVLKAKEDFVRTYQAGSDYWVTTGLDRSDEVAAVLFDHLDQVISYHHANAQKSKLTADYLEATGWYRIFLSSFPEHEDVDEKRWLLAEALYDAGHEKESLVEYNILAYLPNTLAQDRKEEAAFRLSLGAQTDYDKIKDTQSRKALISENERYLTHFISFQRSADVTAQTIELHLEDGNIESAISFAAKLMQSSFATSSQVLRSQIVIADGEYDLGNYLAAELAYSTLLNDGNRTTNSLTQAQISGFKDRRAKAIFKQAESLKVAGNDQAAIDMFKHLANVEPESPERILGDYDIAMLLLAANLYEQAISQLLSFEQNFPRHELAKSVPAKLLLAYEATENWSAAADQYEHLAETSTDAEVKRTALWQAAENRMKLEEFTSLEKSTMLWKKYIKTFPQPVNLALEARQHLINIYGQMTAISDQNLKWKQDFWRRKIITTVDTEKLTDSRARNLASDALMSIVNDKMVKYRGMELSQPLAKSLQKKQSLMKALISDYTKVIDYGIQADVTEAGFHLGETYALLADSMMKSERPKGMTDIELEEYDLVLEEKVFPVEDQAIAAYESNITLAKDGIWDEWIVDSYKALEKLMPARYNKKEAVDD